MDYRRLLKTETTVFVLAAFSLSLFLSSWLLVPGFGTVRNMNNLLNRSIPLFCVGFGQTIVMIVAGIDLTVGAVLSLGTAIASSVMGINVFVGVLAVLASGVFIGFINGLGSTLGRINPFVMTLGMMEIIRGVALYIRPKPGGYVPPIFVKTVLAKWGNFPVSGLLIVSLLVLAGNVLLFKTTWGRHFYSAGGNEEAARLAGIKVHRTKILAFMACGFLAALGSLYMAAKIGSGDPSIGASFFLDSIGVAVLGGAALTGGKGSCWGTLFAVIIFCMVANILNLLDVNYYWQEIVRGCIIITVVAVSFLGERS